MEKREQINSGNLEIFSEKIFKFLNGRRFAIIESEREQSLVSPKSNPSQKLAGGLNGNKAVYIQYSEKDGIYANLIIVTLIRIFDFPILKKGYGDNPLISFNEKYFTFYFKDNHGKEAFYLLAPRSFIIQKNTILFLMC